MATPKWWKIVLCETERKGASKWFYVPICGDTVLHIPFDQLPLRVRLTLHGVKNYQNYLDIYERFKILLTISDMYDIYKLADQWGKK